MEPTHIIDEIKLFAAQHQRPCPVIIGASKTQDVDAIQQAQHRGLTHVGENYVQEMHAKWANGAYKSLILCFIGHLQSRKAALVAEICDEVHSVDREKVAQKLEEACATLGKTLPVMIQVNQGEENQKGGCAPAHLPDLVCFIRNNCPHLEVTGLMTLPPAGENATPYFEELAGLAHEFGLPHLNMGMSADWQQALLCGATHVRIGTALFGTRV